MNLLRRKLLLTVPALAIGSAPVARAAAALQAAPSAEDAISPAAFRQAKEAMLEETIALSQRALARDAVHEALAWQGEFPQSALFRAFEIPILPAHLDETRYDAGELRRRYPVQIGAIGPATGTRRHARVIGSLDKDPQFKQDGYLAEHYGNCFYWNAADTIVTTEHLAEMFPERAKASLRRDALDISVATLGPQFAARAAEQIIHDDASVADEEIQGSLVCIVGRDPDAFADMDGAKVYPGIAVKMTPEFVTGALSEISHGRKDLPLHEYERYIARARARMNNAYMLVLPPGEARSYPGDDDELPCQGMSASPVFGFIRGRYRPVGIFFLAMCLEDAERRRMVDVAFFHPVSAVRKIAADPKGYWTLR